MQEGKGINNNLVRTFGLKLHSFKFRLPKETVLTIIIIRCVILERANKLLKNITTI